MTETITSQTFIPGQRVIVYGAFGARGAIVGTAGTVVKLPRPGGLLHDPFITVELLGESGSMGPVRSVDPRRVAPASTCQTCHEGCDCDGSPDRPGCGHWACWGPATVTETLYKCPGAAEERAQSEAYKVARGWLR